LTRATHQLRTSSESARLEAEILLAHILGLSRADLYAYPELTLPTDQLTDYQALINRRLRGEPLPYLTGQIEFYGLDFAVDARVLVPRSETETLVDLALKTLRSAHRHCKRSGAGPPLAPAPTFRLSLADVGTGSGCVAVALAVHAPHVHIYALDLSTDALAVARTNAARHGVVDRITFLESDLLTALPEAVDLIVANLPYVATDEWSMLPPEVGKHEPPLALDGGPGGLSVIRRLLDQATAQLRPSGALLAEIGASQGLAVLRMAHHAFPGADITLHADLAGRDRVLCIKTLHEQVHHGHP
jgi:release factor glutamine methyltransferase